MAGRLNTDWFVVYVETPGEAPDRIDAEAQRHLLANIERARELGAEVVRLQGARPGRGAPRLRALARRRPHHHRPLAPAVVAAAARPLGAAAPGARGRRASTCTSSRSTRRSRARDAARASSCSRRRPLLARAGRDRRRSGSLTATSLGRELAGDPARQLPQRARRAAHEGGARAARQRRRCSRRRRARARGSQQIDAARAALRDASCASRRATSPSPARPRRPQRLRAAWTRYAGALDARSTRDERRRATLRRATSRELQPALRAR